MTNIILDLDTGVDDSIALFLSAVHPDVNLLGVLGTYGNVTLSESVRNSLSILHAAGRDDVPVYRGKENSLSESGEHVPSQISRRIHGNNGTGNVTFPLSPRSVEEENGIGWLIRMIEKYDGNLVYVATGALTNLAFALILEPSLSSSKVRVVSMGGALTVRGNVSPVAEANIHKDPEAARTVFESGLDVTMVGLDVTMRSRLRKSDAEKWINTGKEAGRLLGSMLLYYIENTTGGFDTYVHDPSAVVCALHPEYFTLLRTPLTVETEGEERGRVYVPSERILERDASTKAAVDVRSTHVEAELESILTFLNN